MREKSKKPEHEAVNLLVTLLRRGIHIQSNKESEKGRKKRTTI